MIYTFDDVISTEFTLLLLFVDVMFMYFNLKNLHDTVRTLAFCSTKN